MSRHRALILALITLALALLAAPLGAEAQAEKVPRVGIMMGPAMSVGGHLAQAFRDGLRDAGYVEGQNILIEYRWAGGNLERFPDFAAELVRLKVDIIVAPTTHAALAAKKATATIPIIHVAMVADPVASGLAASLGRPGGNVTGLTFLPGPEIVGKYLELLKEALPRVSRVAVLRNPTHQWHPLLLKEAELAGRTLRLELQPVEARARSDIDGAFGAIIRGRAGALLVLPDPMFFSERTRMVALADKSRLPVMYGIREHAEAGGLMAYGANVADLYRRAAIYVDKILKGARPGDLPVERPARFVLVINLKTAKRLGLTIPPSVLVRADEVIE